MFAMQGGALVDGGDLQRLFSYYTGTQYLETELLAIQQKCNQLFAKDSQVHLIQNREGQLCKTYPPEIVVIERTLTGGKSGPRLNDGASLEVLMEKARFARVRTRFPVPVLVYRGKNVCRSSTLSQKIECLLQNVHNNKISVASVPMACVRSTNNAAGMMDEDELMESTRGSDVELIKSLQVDHICDLMVENKKIKYFIAVSSSEKVDSKGRYQSFALSSIPYPGCEFFRDFKANHHSAEDLKFDWSQLTDEAHLQLPPTLGSLSNFMSDYKSWDLLVLTKNYLKLQLSILARSDSSGLLVHCISGWDRTPLFVSLIRLSLWADDEVHQSLSAKEVLYLTLGYDWLLFRHHLVDRATKGEDIFYFCFYLLEHISGSDFAISSIEKDVIRAEAGGRKASNGGVRNSSPRALPMRSPRLPNSLGSHRSPTGSSPVAIPTSRATDCGERSSYASSLSACSGSIGSWEFVPEGAKYMEDFMNQRGLPPAEYLDPPAARTDLSIDDFSIGSPPCTGLTLPGGRCRQDSLTCIEEDSFFSVGQEAAGVRNTRRADRLKSVHEEFTKIYGNFALRSSAQGTYDALAQWFLSSMGLQGCT